MSFILFLRTSGGGNEIFFPDSKVCVQMQGDPDSLPVHRVEFTRQNHFDRFELHLIRGIAGNEAGEIFHSHHFPAQYIGQPFRFGEEFACGAGV